MQCIELVIIRRLDGYMHESTAYCTYFILFQTETWHAPRDVTSAHRTWSQCSHVISDECNLAWISITSIQRNRSISTNFLWTSNKRHKKTPPAWLQQINASCYDQLKSSVIPGRVMSSTYWLSAKTVRAVRHFPVLTLSGLLRQYLPETT